MFWSRYKNVPWTTGYVSYLYVSLSLNEVFMPLVFGVLPAEKSWKPNRSCLKLQCQAQAYIRISQTDENNVLLGENFKRGPCPHCRHHVHSKTLVLVSNLRSDQNYSGLFLIPIFLKTQQFNLSMFHSAFHFVCLAVDVWLHCFLITFLRKDNTSPKCQSWLWHSISLFLDHSRCFSLSSERSNWWGWFATKNCR